jgi:hypothetical protein
MTMVNLTDKQIDEIYNAHTAFEGTGSLSALERLNGVLDEAKPKATKGDVTYAAAVFVHLPTARNFRRLTVFALVFQSASQ